MTQFLSWGLLFAPWLLLIFLDKRKMKHFLAVAFFTGLLTTIYFQTAQVYGWWEVTGNIFFLTVVSSFAYGLLPVTTLIVFYFLYPRFLLFIGVNLVIDAIQAFVISPYIFQAAGLYRMTGMSDFGLFLLIISVIPFSYVFQLLYDGGRQPRKSKF